jgi:hypothetical protein
MSLAVRGIAFVLIASAAAPAAAQRSCPTPGEPTVRLEFRQPKPALDTMRMLELRRMSREGLGEHDQALGLYKNELRTALRVDYAVTTRGDMSCVALREVTVEAEYSDRRIYLARELQPGTCQYDVTLAHEHQHARIDDTVFGRELPKLKQALARAAEEVGVTGPIRPRDVESYRGDINERLERIFQRELNRIGQIRRREQSQIDTPESYRRESERCPGGIAVK